MIKKHITSGLLISILSLHSSLPSFAMEEEDKGKQSIAAKVSTNVGGYHKKTHTEGDNHIEISGGGSHNISISNFKHTHPTSTNIKEKSDGVNIFVPDIIKICSARYGANGWFRNGFNDVEPWVEPKFNNKPVGDIPVSNKNLGGDPAKGHIKTLNVFYKCMRGDIESNIMNGKAKEGDILRLSCSNNKDKKF